MKHWEKLSSESIHQDKWISLRADECRLPNGSIISPYYVLEEKDWIHVIALNEKNEVLVLRQYRYAGDSVCSEIPAGCIEEDESPLQAAKRELKEETGFEADQWELVISPFANPARQTNRIYVFRATGLKDTGFKDLDDNEDIEHFFMSIKELKKKIFSGDFSQALQIASVFTTLDGNE